MFQLTDQPINPETLRVTHRNTSTGALVSFEGIVRADKHQDKDILSLSYIADEPACIAEGDGIIQETFERFPISHALCIQRTGNVPAGETAIWIGVWSPHRDAGFKACRYIIEETKKRLLIWKKEHFKDGNSQWVRGMQTPPIAV